MVDSYRIMIYAQSGKSVINVGRKPIPVDELQVDVPSWAEYNIKNEQGGNLAQFVMVCEGRAQIEESRSGDTIYRKCRIVEG